MPGDNIQSVNGAGIGGIVTSVDGQVGAVDSSGGSGVTSVDGSTGVVVLSGTYLALAGGTLVGALTGTTMTGTVLTGTTAVRAGATPWASSGQVRLPSLGQINWRNAADSGDIGGFSSNASDQVQIGSDLVGSSDSFRNLGSSSIRWANVLSIIGTFGGNNPASAGALRMPNATSVVWRNAANSGNVTALTVNASDQLSIGADLVPSSDSFRNLGAAALRWANILGIIVTAGGNNPAASGQIRLPNGSQINFRNNANSSDIVGLAVDSSDRVIVGADFAPASDNTRALGTGALRWASITAAGEIIGKDLAPASTTGATVAVRYFRGTASGAPTTGTWVAGDKVPSLDGNGWTCTVGGTPGTWVQDGSGTYQTLANIDTDSAMAANSDTKYASQKATKTALAAKAPTASPTFTGTVTVPDATANTAAAALRQAMFAEVAVPLVSTYYVRSPAQLGTTTGTPTLNLMTCVPIVFTNAGTLVSIAAANNANTATAVCRLGLYADNGSGRPGALIDDYGTVDFSTGPGTKTIVISRAVTAMTLYWLAAVEQNAATSAKVASNGSGSGLTPGYTTPLNSTIPTQCWTQASVSAGLPNPAVVTATGTSSIIVEVKI